MSGQSGVVPLLTPKHPASRIDEVRALAKETENTVLVAKPFELSRLANPVVSESGIGVPYVRCMGAGVTSTLLMVRLLRTRRTTSTTSGFGATAIWRIETRSMSYEAVARC